MNSTKHKLISQFRSALRCGLLVASIGAVSLQNNLCAGGMNNLSVLAQSDLLGLASTDRVLTSHEKRLDQLKKELETISKDIAKEVAHEHELEEEITHLNKNLEGEKSNARLAHEFKDATFIVASDRSALAIQYESGDRFRLMAKADLKQTKRVKDLARDLSIPIVLKNDSSFEASCLNLAKGDSFPGDAVKVLKEHWKVRQYVPVAPNDDLPMILFRDLETNQDRIGYYLGPQNGSFQLVSLTGKRELVARDRIESGSSRIGSRDELLVEPEANVIDVAALEIAKHLGTDKNTPSHQLVTISVEVDELEEALKLSKQLDQTYNDSLLDLLSRLNGQTYVPDQRKQGARILRSYQMVLHDQLSQRLVDLGVPVGNREDLSAIRDERKLSQSEDFDRRRFTPMTSASHMITASVGKPESGGKFRVSIRLNEINSARTLLEFDTDIGRPAQRFPTDYFIQSGAPTLLVDRSASGRTSRETAQSIKLPELEQSTTDSRLVVFAKLKDQNRIYDLFSNNGQNIDNSRFSGKLISDPESLPNHQKFRWLTWELARTALPKAGRVRSLENDRIEINLGSNHGVNPGAVFRVMRQDSSGYHGSTQILPMELKADTVLPDSTTAVVQHDGLQQLWPELNVDLDDIVLLKGLSNHVIKVESPTASVLLTPKDAAKKLNVAFKNKGQLGRLGITMGQVGDQMVTKMLQGLKSQGIQAFSVNSQNPTHLVTSEISPLEASPDCGKFAIQFSVYSVKDNRSVTLPAIRLNSKEIANWQP
jgi:hypothetical protein